MIRAALPFAIEVARFAAVAAIVTAIVLLAVGLAPDVHP